MNRDEADMPIVAEAARPQPPKVGESRGGVLLLLFVALGPLALGVLWKSSRFSTPWKVVLSALTLGQFVLAVWLLWFIARWMLAGGGPLL